MAAAPIELEKPSKWTQLEPATRSWRRSITHHRAGWLTALTCAMLVGCALGGMLIHGVATLVLMPSHRTCLGGWPLFRTRSALAAHEAWAGYMRSVYGDLPPADLFPLCMGDFWYFYGHGLDAADLAASLPATGDCPRDDGRVEGQRYDNHSRLSPPDATWSWHPAPHGFAPLEAGAWVEVLHKGGIADEHVGAWFLSARGSGIWLNLGVTLEFDDHADAWEYFGVTAVPGKFARNEALCANASAAGFDTLQFVRHTCVMMYADCLNESQPNLTYFNREVVATRLQGIHPCASADGASPLLRTGWPHAARGAQCTCDNNASEHLHCAEVALSMPSGRAGTGSP